MNPENIKKCILQAPQIYDADLYACTHTIATIQAYVQLAGSCRFVEPEMISFYVWRTIVPGVATLSTSLNLA